MRANIRVLGMFSIVIILAVLVYILGVFVNAAPPTSIQTLSDTVAVNNETPTVEFVNLDDTFPGYTSGAGGNIDLGANTTKQVWCVGVVEDLNGQATISNVTARLYDDSYDPEAESANTNYLYLNTTAPGCPTLQKNGTAKYFNCTFNVQWYANQTTWKCNANVTDDYGYVGGGTSAQRTVNPQTNIEVYESGDGTTSTTVDFGTLSVGETSAADENVTLESYSNVILDFNINGTDLDCAWATSLDIGVGNVTWAGAPGVAYGSMTALTATKSAAGASVAKSTDGTVNTNTTYWKIQIPKGVVGTCTGGIEFEGQAA